MNGGGTVNLDDDMTAGISLQSGPADTDALLAMLPSLSEYRPGGKIKLGLSVSGGLAKKETIEIGIKDLTQDSDKAKFKLDASAKLTSPMRISFDLDADKINLDKMTASPSDASAEAGESPAEKPPAKEKKSKTKSSSDLSGYAVQGKIRADSLFASGVGISNLSSKVSLKKGVLSMPDLKMAVLGGSVSGPVSLDLNRESMPGDVSLNLTGFVVESLMKKFTGFPAVLSGTGGGKVSVSFAGTSTAALKKARGKGHIDIDNGKLKGLDLVDGLISQWARSEAVKKVVMRSLEPSIKTSIGEETPFKELDARFDLGSGKIEISRAVMDIPEGSATFSGWVGMDGAVSLNGRIRLSRAITSRTMAEARKWVVKQSGGQIGGSALDLLLDEGRLVLPFSLTGAWPKPKLLFDARAYGKTVERNLKKQAPKKIIEQVVGEEKAKEIEKEVKKKVEEVLGEEGRKILEGILPRLY
jgi:uncharacterized protein involved in outer membrane biogenesis